MDWTQQFASIFFGWLLGILSPALVEHIRKAYRLNSLIKAVNKELHEFSYLMATVTYRLNEYGGDLTDEYLDWFISKIENYAGEEPVENIRVAAPALRQLPSAEIRYAACYPNGNAGAGVRVIKYDIPLLDAHSGEIALFPIKSQTILFKIMKKLKNFNQHTEIISATFEKTFSDLSDRNREIVLQNLARGYKNLARDARTLSELCSKGIS